MAEQTGAFSRFFRSAAYFPEVRPGSREMTVEAFHGLPLHPGWKCEYWDGRARLSPRHCPVGVERGVAVPEARGDLTVMPATEADEAPLRWVYAQAFLGSAEFVGADLATVRRCAQRDIRGHFEKEPLPASCMAWPGRSRKGRPLGMMLVTREMVRYLNMGGGPRLEVVAVRPDCQRQGVATALLAYVCRALSEGGHARVMSIYDLANEASRAWHHARGFAEIPNLLYRRACQLRDAAGPEAGDAKDRWDHDAQELASLVERLRRSTA